MKFTKDEGSSFLNVVIVWGMFAIAIIITIYVYAIALTSAVKSQMENDLSIANLSAATIDLDHYTDTGEFVLNDVRKCYRDFIDTLTINLQLENIGSNTFKPKKGSYFEGIISNMSVTNFYVYNIDGTYITLDRYNASTDVVDTTNYYSTISTPDHVNVNNPTIYSKIQVDLTLPGQDTKTVTRENSVAVVTNK